MAMVIRFIVCPHTRVCGSSQLAWFQAWEMLGTLLYLSRELSKLSQWLCHNDSTTNTILGSHPKHYTPHQNCYTSYNMSKVGMRLLYKLQHETLNISQIHCKHLSV